MAARLISHHSAPHATKDALYFLQQTASATLVFAENTLNVRVEARHVPAEVLPPTPYGLKGGAAREVLTATLGVRAIREPRDIDIIRRGSFAVSSDDAIAQRYMPRDYQHGARVEIVRDLNRYLTSRDITINEVGLFDHSLCASLIAALDTVGHTIRPSHYRGGSIHRLPTLDGRTLLKMARLFAEAEVYDEPSAIVGIPDQISFSEFDLALQLNKAFQRGQSVAQKFVETLVLLGALEASSNPLSDTLHELAHLRHGERGLFPDVPPELFKESKLSF